MKRTGKKTSSAGSKVFLLLFSLPFAGVGVFMLFLTVQTIRQSRRAASWIETPCRLLSVELETSRGSDSTTYRCVARYNYEFEGRSYGCDRVSFSKGADNVGSFQQDCYYHIKARGEDESLRCYVNPEEPTEAVIFRSVRWGMIGFYMVFVLAFGGVGFGMLIFGVFGVRSKKKEDTARREHPQEPWLWRADWREGVIKAADKAGTIAITVFALFWNVIAFPMGIMAFFEGFLKDGQKGALVALLFPLVGVLLIVWAAYAVLKYRKYGTTTLELASVPGVIGGKLAGVIHVPVHVRTEEGFRMRLACIHRYTTGSGKNRHTHEDMMWEDTRLLESELLSTDYSRTALPVLFAIPYQARESTLKAGSDGIVWRLEAEAETRGIDFKTTFEVPVFKTADSDPDFALDDTAIRRYEKSVSPEEVIDKHKLTREATMDGVCYRFPAARHIGHAVSVTFFFAVWTAFVAGMIAFKAPILFPIIFGLIDLLVLWGVIDQWAVSSRVEIGRRTVTVTRGVFGIGVPKIVPCLEVKDVKATKGAQSGQTVFYSIKLVTDSGKKVVIGNNIVDRKDAMELAAQIEADISGRSSRRSRSMPGGAGCA